MQRILAIVLGSLAVCGAHATEMFSPGLPASSEQPLACRIVNVSKVNQVVTSQAVDGAGGIVSAVYNELLKPGEAGGFSVAGSEASVHCRFIVSGARSDFRASIEVFEVTSAGNFRIVAALPAN